VWVFRDGKETFESRRLLRDLQAAVRAVCAQPQVQERQLDALIRAGELESATADLASPSTQVFTNITDAAAFAFVRRDGTPLSRALTAVERVGLPSHLTISPQEGFAYYALHPENFVQATSQLARPGETFAVIGIRSIGSTLSAVVRAALLNQGVQAERITVRPTGHPFDRVTNFSPDQQIWVRARQASGAQFVVVDEGPGLSGSSFISVGEALAAAGVARERITFVGSRQPNPGRLCARDGANRWRQFHWTLAHSDAFRRLSGGAYLGGGAWRRLLLPNPEWPACWTQMERLKFLSPDRRLIHKFEGFGRFGHEVKERAQCLARAGYSSPVEDYSDGIIAYSCVPGKPMSADDLSPAVLERLAEYCAFRAKEFRISGHPRQQLEEVLPFNLNEEFGNPQGGFQAEDLLLLQDDLPLLNATNPVLVDGRMQPWEWIRSEDGKILKVDACTHGDDHFLPGPTDIAWDLAGAIVEWDMNASSADRLIERYAQLSGDEPSRRLPIFLLAYTVFRLGYCKMAAQAEAGSAEENRLLYAYQHYRDLAEQQLVTEPKAA